MQKGVAGAVRDVGKIGLIQLQAYRNCRQGEARQGKARKRQVWSRSLFLMQKGVHGLARADGADGVRQHSGINKLYKIISHM